jgi:outer membrane protein assembly factor BamB
VGSKYPCLFALDAQNGQKKWCFSYPSDIAWVESSAAVANGVVYVGSSDWMRLNAIDAATGQLRWYFRTKGDPWCSPAVAEGVVYIGATGGYFYALDATAGRELWRVRTDKGLKTMDIRFDGGVVSSPTVVDGMVYFGSMDGKLYAVSTAL